MHDAEAGEVAVSPLHGEIEQKSARGPTTKRDDFR